MQISLKALTRVLLDAGNIFTIERCLSEPFKERNVIQFVVGNKYPETGHHASVGTNIEIQDLADERRWKRADGGRVVLQFDMDNDKVLSSCFSWHALLMDAKSAAAAKNRKELVL